MSAGITRCAALFGVVLLPLVAQASDCIEGERPASVEVGNPVSIPVDSVARTNAITLREKGGNRLMRLDVVLTLPSTSPSARFMEWVDGKPRDAADPKRAVIRINDACNGTFPPMMADSSPGQYVMRVDVPAYPGVGVDVQVTNIPTPIPTGIALTHAIPSRLLIAHVGSPFPVSSDLVQVFSDVNQGAAHIPVTFSLPSQGAGATFADGTTSKTVMTDKLGLASPPAFTANGQVGTYNMIASAPGTGAIEVLKLANGGESRIVLTQAPGVVSHAGGIWQGTVTFPDAPCNLIRSAGMPRQALGGSQVRLRVDGLLQPEEKSAPITSDSLSCTAAGYEVGFSVGAILPFGTHEVVAEYWGSSAFGASTSAKTTVTVTPAFTAASPSGGEVRGAATNAATTGTWTCGFTRATVDPAARDVTSPPPADFEFRHGFLSFELGNCTHDSGFSLPQPTGGTQQRMQLEFPAAIPREAGMWAYGPTAQDPSPHWYRLEATMSGALASFFLEDGGAGDVSLVKDKFIRGVVALGYAKTAQRAAEVEGLWWGGEAQNGWGMSVAKHGEKLFNVLFLYDENGRPQWVVMPGGQWNSDNSSYTGPLYIPSGSPWSGYDAARLNVGAPVGNATLSFDGSDRGRLVYEIRGVSGSKEIQRQAFGPPDTKAVASYGDLWWGGIEQNGWGLAIAQQFRTLFAVWYTYDDAGRTTWYVMSGGAWNGVTYSGALYRTSGSAWIGAAYDPGSFLTIPVGTMELAYAHERFGTMSYVIDGVAGSKTIRRQPF